jgi:hypothetical protein
MSPFFRCPTTVRPPGRKVPTVVRSPCSRHPVSSSCTTSRPPPSPTAKASKRSLPCCAMSLRRCWRSMSMSRLPPSWKPGRLPVVLGGDHSVSIGAIQAAAAAVSTFSVLQVDAHLDSRESYQGSAYNHACVMARARELADIVQVGIRSADAAEIPSLDPKRVFWAHRILERPTSEWVEEAVSLLSESVWVSIDLDGLDPAILPATGTPVPGGLHWHHLQALLARISDARRVIGFDVVELCPHPAHWGSDFLAGRSWSIDSWRKSCARENLNRAFDSPQRHPACRGESAFALASLSTPRLCGEPSQGVRPRLSKCPEFGCQTDSGSWIASSNALEKPHRCRGRYRNRIRSSIKAASSIPIPNVDLDTDPDTD